jgi:hypothetical protein
MKFVAEFASIVTASALWDLSEIWRDRTALRDLANDSEVPRRNPPPGKVN